MEFRDLRRGVRVYASCHGAQFAVLGIRVKGSRVWDLGLKIYGVVCMWGGSKNLVRLWGLLRARKSLNICKVEAPTGYLSRPFLAV